MIFMIVLFSLVISSGLQWVHSNLTRRAVSCISNSGAGGNLSAFG